MTTFAVVTVTLIVMHVVLHSDGGTVFRMSRAELLHELLVAAVLTVVLMLMRSGRR
ncbi:MAG TPA: hypothetical protein VL405_03715 [Sphingomonas sp.]|nr:hypothetical protein [Sphingomonas sp.]